MSQANRRHLSPDANIKREPAMKKILGKNIPGNGRCKGPKVGAGSAERILEKRREGEGVWQGKCWARNSYEQVTSWSRDDGQKWERSTALVSPWPVSAPDKQRLL